VITPASINEVQNRTDIVEIVGQFVRLKKRGANYIGNCPFHSEKTPSFSVSASKGIYKCFGCGKAGNAVTFIQEHEKLTYPEAIRWLAEYYKVALEETTQSPERVQQYHTEESLRVLNDWAAKYFHQELYESEEGNTIGLSYFKHRGFRKEIIERFLLGYNADNGLALYSHATQQGYTAELLEKAGLVKNRNGQYFDTYRGRVIFPIQNMTGRVLGFGARILKSNDKAPKYINSPENELYIKSKVLYGMFQSRKAIVKEDECFLVEGYTDVISLHQGGVENVLASSGTSLTEDQLRLIGQLTKNLTILYDGDAAGIKAALRGLDMALSQSFQVKLVLLPEGEDPDSFIQNKGATLFHEYVKANKQDIINFRLEVGLKEIGNDPVAKSKLINEIAESISKINKAEDFSLQHYYIKETIQKLDLDEAAMVNLVNKYIRERLEQEQRQKGKPTIPTPTNEEVFEEFPQTINTSSAQDEKDWELMRILLAHGNKPIEGFLHVADMINQCIDQGFLENPFVQSVFKEYYQYYEQTGILLSETHFINHPDAALRTMIAAKVHPNNEISHNWSAIYGIETLNGEENYINEVESAISYFDLKNILKMQDEMTRLLEKETDVNTITKLQMKFMKLRLDEREIVKKYGTTVYKHLKKR